MKEPEISRVEIPLVEPHFDEEATVLHAQPVVPLETVRAQSRARRNVFLVIALVGALMLGAASATLIYKNRAVDSEKGVTETALAEPASPTNVEAVASGGTTDESVASEANPQFAAPKVQEKKATVVTRPEKPSAAERTPNRSEEKQTRVQQPKPAVEEDWDAMMREAKRAARRRKAERREERARRDADSAGRIRDIFEGPNP